MTMVFSSLDVIVVLVHVDFILATVLIFLYSMM